MLGHHDDLAFVISSTYTISPYFARVIIVAKVEFFEINTYPFSFWLFIFFYA